MSFSTAIVSAPPVKPYSIEAAENPGIKREAAALNERHRKTGGACHAKNSRPVPGIVPVPEQQTFEAAHDVPHAPDLDVFRVVSVAPEKN